MHEQHEITCDMGEDCTCLVGDARVVAREMGVLTATEIAVFPVRDCVPPLVPLVTTTIGEFRTALLDQSLYRLSAPIVYAHRDEDGVEEARETSYVVVSASHKQWLQADGVKDLVHETYIFAADADGDVLSWSELEGSEQGVLDHEHVLRSFGATTITRFKSEPRRSS
jgi:hypothetical protein